MKFGGAVCNRKSYSFTGGKLQAIALIKHFYDYLPPLCYVRDNGFKSPRICWVYVYIYTQAKICTKTCHTHIPSSGLPTVWPWVIKLLNFHTQKLEKWINYIKHLWGLKFTCFLCPMRFWLDIVTLWNFSRYLAVFFYLRITISFIRQPKQNVP